MTLLEKSLNTIKNLRGTEVEVFGQPHQVESTIEYSDLTIDVVEVFENLKEYEITSYEYYNDDTEDYEELNFDDCDDFISYMEDLYGIEEVRGDNSYNWGSPISNHFYIHEYYNRELSEYYYVVAIHKFGDVRGNYTNEFVLKFDNDYAFFELLNGGNKYYTLHDKEGNELYFDLGIFDEGLTYEGEYSYNGLELFAYENIEDLQKDILNL